MKEGTVSQALKWLFIAEILMIVGAFIPLIGAILIIVGFVMNLVALHKASKLDDGYHTAFVLSIAGIVVSIISTFAGGILDSILSILTTVISLGILYYVVMTTVKHLEAEGSDDVAARGVTVWKLNMICTVVSVILSVLALIPVIQILAALLAVIVTIVEVVAGILYLIFLYKSYNALA